MECAALEFENFKSEISKMRISKNYLNLSKQIISWAKNIMSKCIEKRQNIFW